MKKITFILAVVAAMVSLASCNKEVAAPADAENGITATFTVNLPEQTATKAISDGTLANELLFFAYDAAGNHLDLDQTVAVSGKHASVSVNLVGGITYQFVFWAQKAGQYTDKFSGDKKTLTLDPTEMMNSDAWDAFYYKMTKAVESSFSETVTLTRPFAQLNLGAPVELNDSNERTGGDFWSANKSGIKIDNTLQTSYKIKANNVLSLLDGTASGETEYTLTAASHPSEFLTVGGVKYDYAAMAYLLANTTKSELTDLEITLNTEQGTNDVSLTRTVHNVPLQRNYRTNVLGNVFTLEANFDIVVDSDFTKDDNGNVVDHLPEYADIAALNAAFAKNPAEDAEKWSYKVKVLTAGDTKTIVLPKTLDPVDIYFAEGAFVNEDITIAYAEGATDGEKPVKLTIEAPLTGSNTKSINTLVGNLPATTVVLAGTTTVDTADFHTASSTLHLMPKAKIINKLTVYAGSLLVEGFIETAVIDPSVAVNTVDAVAKVAEDGEVVRFVVQNLSAVIESGAKVGSLEVSTTAGYTGTAPTVTVQEDAVVETLNIENGTGSTPVGTVTVDSDAQVNSITGDTATVQDEKGDPLCFVYNKTELEAAIAAQKARIYFKGESAIDENLTLVPTIATVINDLKVSSTSNSEQGPVVTISGPVSLYGAEIKTKAYCALQISENVTANLNGCWVETLGHNKGNARAINILGGTTVSFKGCTVKAADQGAYSRGLNLLDSGAHVTVEDCNINVAEYAINYPTDTKNTVVVVTNSTVDGWCITNMWDDNNTISFENCKLNSLNDKSYDANHWNDFCAFKLNNNSGNTSDNNSILVNNCDINVTSTTGNIQTVVGYNGQGNVLKFVGTSQTYSHGEENVKFSHNSGVLFNGQNLLYMDATNKALFEPYFEAEDLVVNGPEEGLYSITYVPEVYYYWVYEEGYQGSYCSLATPFASEWLMDGEYISLQKNITLHENIECKLSEGQLFYMNFGEFSITKGEYSIKMPTGVLVVTDKQADVFSPADSNATMTETANGDGTYTYCAAVAN